jgi:hypothetical protein
MSPSLFVINVSAMNRMPDRAMIVPMVINRSFSYLTTLIREISGTAWVEFRG